MLGEKNKICIVDTEKVIYEQTTRTIYLPKDQPRERLVKWLKDNAKRILTAVTAETASRMGVKYASVSITSARGRWGSCSGNDAIHYSFRLLYAPKEILEYVAVHELSHVKHKNHSKAFWDEVAKHEPHWKQKRAWLKRHGGLLEIF